MTVLEVNLRRTVRSKKYEKTKIHFANREESRYLFFMPQRVCSWCYNIYEMYSIGSVRKAFFPIFVSKPLNRRDICDLIDMNRMSRNVTTPWAPWFPTLIFDSIDMAVQKSY